MPDETELEELEVEGEVQPDGNVEAPPSLPDGFDPTAHGFVSRTELDKLQKERDEFEQRYNDTRTQFNQERTSVHRELADIKARMGNGGYGHQPTPQPISSVHALTAYQQNQTMDAYNVYQQALMRETLAPHFDSIRNELNQTRRELFARAEQFALKANPALAHINTEEIDASFDANRGGNPASYEEGYYVVQARKAGGFAKLIEKYQREGEAKFLDDVKSGKRKFQNIPPGTPPRTGKRSSDPDLDLDRMTDTEILAMSEDKDWGI